MPFLPGIAAGVGSTEAGHDTHPAWPPCRPRRADSRHGRAPPAAHCRDPWGPAGTAAAALCSAPWTPGIEGSRGQVPPEGAQLPGVSLCAGLRRSGLLPVLLLLLFQLPASPRCPGQVRWRRHPAAPTPASLPQVARLAGATKGGDPDSGDRSRRVLRALTRAWCSEPVLPEAGGRGRGRFHTFLAAEEAAAAGSLPSRDPAWIPAALYGQPGAAG